MWWCARRTVRRSCGRRNNHSKCPAGPAQGSRALRQATSHGGRVGFPAQQVVERQESRLRYGVPATPPSLRGFIFRNLDFACEVPRLEPDGDVVFPFREDVVGDTDEPHVCYLDARLFPRLASCAFLWPFAVLQIATRRRPCSRAVGTTPFDEEHFIVLADQ